MPPPPPRKPAPGAAPAESFIGNDSSTMMSEETFEEFEARMKSSKGSSPAESMADNTNTNPAIEERDEGEEASASMGINDKAAGTSTKGGGGSMTFDKYVEVMTAQSCWAQQGKDANLMLKKVFNMNAVDWSNASAYWAQKMSTDVALMRDQFPVLSARYTQKYTAGVDDPQGDLDV